ncbi:glycosyltransferase family 1 protein, partial [filamentous cyanobacterium CCP1]
KYSDDFLRYAESFNLPQCYDLANGLYQKLQLTTKINVSEKIDLWHATYPLPMQVRGARKITTIHDLIPLRLPYATLDDKRVFYLKIRDALKDSEVIITVSENSKQDILRYFDVDPDKIFVTYQPIALKPLEDTEEGIATVLGRYGLKPQNYLMFVGAIEPKKNLGRLLDAYSSIDTDMPLVIVGKKGWLWEEELGKASLFFDNKDSKKKVKLFEYVSMDLLRYLYKGAFCLAFPSLYEGFGLPPVEAMHYGCPVITSNVSCLPEICGDAALYVDPYDFKDIQEKLEMVMGDTTLREQMIKTGYQTAENFSLDNYTRRLYQAYARALQ